MYFGVFVLLLLISGVMIFAQKTSFSPVGVLHYYIGYEVKFITAKTNIGLLKLVSPHIFAFALLSMILLHFLVFTRFKQKVRIVIYLLFGVQFLEIFTPFLIINVAPLFVYLKLLSLFVYLMLLLSILLLLVISIIKE